MTTTTVRRPMAVFGKKGIVPFALRAEARGTIIIRGIFVQPHAITPGRMGAQVTLVFGLRGRWRWRQIPIGNSVNQMNVSQERPGQMMLGRSIFVLQDLK